MKIFSDEVLMMQAFRLFQKLLFWLPFAWKTRKQRQPAINDSDEESSEDIEKNEVLDTVRENIMPVVVGK